MTREESKWNNTNAQSNPPKLEKDGKAKAETKNKSNKLKKKKEYGIYDSNLGCGYVGIHLIKNHWDVPYRTIFSLQLNFCNLCFC